MYLRQCHSQQLAMNIESVLYLLYSSSPFPQLRALHYLFNDHLIILLFCNPADKIISEQQICAK